MAVRITAEQIRDRVVVAQVAGSVVGLSQKDGFDLAFWESKRAVAVALIEKYAPLAPSEVQDEGAIRICGYLFDRSAALQDRRQGDADMTQAPGQISALRHSGAMALLSPWKKRRAGVVG